MDALPTLPLVAGELPESIRRFGDPSAPDRTRLVAARGLVPLGGGDLVALLLQLEADRLGEVAQAARASLDALPDPLLAVACDAALPAVFLDALATRLSGRDERLEQIVANDATADATIARVARACAERVAERIAVNEQRVLRAPAIIESLYRNRNTRMSTVDRLVELAARHGLELKGVHTFQAHVEAIAGQLIPEPSDEAMPGDTLFAESLAADAEQDAIARDKVDGSEALKEQFKPLAVRISTMTLQEKLRLSLVGNAAARALLVRDSNKMVSMGAITSPMVTEAEAESIAHSRQVGEEILRYIGSRREWLSNYELKKALCFNPKTPVGISMNFLSHLHVADLRTLGRSRGVAAALKTAALQRAAKKSQQG